MNTSTPRDPDPMPFATHLDDLELAALADGGLSGERRARAEAHLATCADCRAALRDLVEVFEEGGAAAPADLADRVTDRLPIQAPARGGTMFQLRPLTAVAALLIAALGVALWSAAGGDDASGVEPDVLPQVADLPEATPAPEGSTTPPKRVAPLGADPRYLAHVSTDKPLYKPGEVIFARAVLLDAFDRTPVTDGETSQGTFTVKSARGEVVFKQASRALDGVAAFHWKVPEGQTGGQYKVVASFPWLGTPEGEREIDIRAYRAPRLKTDLQFLSKAYGPGDVVQASLECERAEGGPSAMALVTAIARLDGTEVYRKDYRLDRLGRGRVSFTLPATIRDGVGTLALRVVDQGITETAAKTLPIVLQRVDLRFYPEGGELVAGVPCGVYFEAKTPRQKPADVAGRILDDQDREVATFATVHEGRGRTAFTPEVGRSYRAVLSKPAGITEPVALSNVKPDGMTVRAATETYAADRPVRVVVGATRSGAATVGLYQREKELALAPVVLEGGSPVAVTLRPAVSASGVLRVTVYDAAGNPQAERLLYRRPPAGLTVTLTPESEQAIPGGTIRYQVETKDAQGRPVSAVVGLAATDDAVLSTVEPRERPPRLPAQALLGAEVKELKDAGAYLDGTAEGATHTDLLLGTQGWRRFAFVAPQAFVKAYDQEGRRALALTTPQRMTHTAVRFAAPQAGGGGGGAGFRPGGRGGAGAGDGGPGADGGVREDGEEAFGDAVDMAKNKEQDFLERVRELGAAPPEDVPPGDREPNDPVPPAPPGGPAAQPAPAAAPAPAEEPVVADREIEEVEEEVADELAGRARRLRYFEMPPMGGEEAATRARKRVKRVRDARELGGKAPQGWVREYAHASDPDRPAGVRRDFTETVYWHAGLKTDAEGRATIEFAASDAITTIRLRADGFSADGALGMSESTVEVRRPFYVEPKIPLEVSAGDRVEIPLVLVNGTSGELPLSFDVKAEGGLMLANLEGAPKALAPDTATRVLLPVRAGEYRGASTLHVTVNAGAHRDTVVRTVQVVPAGFPIEHAFGGVLEGVAEHTFTIPAKVLPGSATSEAAVYPTPLASMADAMAALLREPGGCFEQTSSSNYPNVMALQYMDSHAGVDPQIVARAQAMLKRGYRKLVSFECKDRGYEWFGGDPGHEALTAYGVLEFHDMAQVMDVDAEMIGRTRAWLLARRDGKGGFQRNSRALDSFGRAPQDITDAYILWALLETKTEGLEKEVAALKARVQASKDSYLSALAANVFALAGDHAEAARLMKRLAEAQEKDGRVGGAATTITRSGGRALGVETTALAVLAWLRVDAHAAQVEQAMQWIAAQCQRGRFGSTQSTILALKAINAYDAKRARVAKPGSVVLYLNGQPIHEAAFEADHQGAIQLPDLAEKLTPGTHTVRLEMKGGATMPYAFAVRFAALTPASADVTPVRVTTTLPMAKAVEGEPVEVRVKVVSTKSEGQPMAVAIVGLPGGLEARAEQLKELVKEGKVDFVETRGREVVLYWRSLAPEAVHELTIDAIAQIPGTYEGPASRAYLYYTDEHKHWVDGLRLEIQPKR